MTCLPLALLVLTGSCGLSLAQSPIYALRGFDVEGQFGSSLAALDDLDGDGVRDFAIAAPNRTTDLGGGAAPVLGAVLAVSGRTGVVLWTRNGAGDGTAYGVDIATVSDHDQDGKADLAVGIRGGFPAGGVAAIELISSADGTTIRRIPGANTSSIIGSVIAPVADVDGDGLIDLLSRTGQGSGPGIVKLFSTATGQELHRFDGFVSGEGFGLSIAEVADVDGDGRRDYAIGAPFRPSSAIPDAGAVVVYSSASRLPALTVEGTRIYGTLGRSIASYTDLDGDGLDEFAVVEGGRITAPFTPAYVRVVSPATGATLQVFSGDSLGPDGFGAGVGRAGDFDRDGVVDLAIGISQSSEAAFEGGAISVRSGATGIEIGRYDSTYEGSRVGQAILDLDDLDADGTVDLVVSGSGRQLPQSGRFGRVIALATPAAPVYEYCRATVPNSTGGKAAMGSSGSTSIAANDFTVSASGLPLQSFGYFLVSDTPNLIPVPGGGPMLCVGGPIGRLNGPGQVQSSGATGRIDVLLDLTSLPSPTGFGPAQPFTTLYFQCWHRDQPPAIPSNFSDGLGAVILP